ncbi:peptide deformylase [Merismopedia glauca]|uniref:Peptide deformylase n=1 Tax=Merismopedia glauca CCAP 1448/3 TaxID=1296344 RepID=A0A2T1C0W3_9CYAN|nr:peptide deformylase [Merismopedia glauca]PSB01807.1 peptide deformylase [Merismopedia glauca CCAP 1448/3]
MSEILPISQLGATILRQRAQEISDLRQSDIQQLIGDLIKTVKSAQGVGIAAPQVDRSYRLIVVASRPNSRYPQAPKMRPTAMINPQIIAHSDEIVKGWEGCLSVPGIRGLVPRYQEIEIEYLNRKGLVKTQVFRDFVARICQHEIDHLEGIVFTDRVEIEAEIITEAEYNRSHS